MKKPSKSAAKSPKSKPAPAQRKPARKKAPASKVTEDVHKFEAARKTTSKRPATRQRTKTKGPDVDNLGELPSSYGDEGIFAVAQEPHWLFCYWDYLLAADIRGPVFLRHGRQNPERIEGEVPVPAGTNSWYVSVKQAGEGYFVELGHYVDGRWKSLTRSRSVLTPRDAVEGFGEPVFANVPFHLTFQQLVERLRGEMREGEDLAAALSRLQSTGRLPLGGLTSPQQATLDSLLSTGLGSLTSGDLGRLLSSPGASMFSGVFIPTSPAGASWSAAPGASSGGFLALMGLLGASWSGASRGGGASWGSTSWSLAAGGAPASWESALTSWSSFSLAGRGGMSSHLSSWHQAAREFFMHVNAEVIFYGGTHPQAKVTVDGKAIALGPDGSFRYHFVLPDGEFEIPIVATSPDGVETRRAVLRFERATDREGDVGDTAQPPLPEPLGRRK
jgi:hypothetical protein